MSDIQSFLRELRPVQHYHSWGWVPAGMNFEGLATSGSMGQLVIAGQRFGLFFHRTQGTLRFHCWTVTFNGAGSLFFTEEKVTFVDSERVEGELTFPKLWGMFSFCNRALLVISSDGISERVEVEIWRPRSDSVGRFRRKGCEIQAYKILADSNRDMMFDKDVDLTVVSDRQWPVLLAALLYFCSHHSYVVDSD